MKGDIAINKIVTLILALLVIILMIILIKNITTLKDIFLRLIGG